MSLDQITPLSYDEVRYVPPDLDEVIEVTLRVSRRDFDHLNRWMDRATIDEANALRNADINARIDSLTALLNHARKHYGTSGGRICATLLASMYNGDRVKFDMSDLRNSLDEDLFEHAINAIRLCRETSYEPHSFFKNGNAIFEQLIADWGLEMKKRKAVPA